MSETSAGTTGDYGFALSWLKAGARVRNVTWRTTNRFIFLVPEAAVVVDRPPLLGFYDLGTTIRYRAHIETRHEDCSIGPWIASDENTFGEWEVYPGDSPIVKPISESPGLVEQAS